MHLIRLRGPAIWLLTMNPLFLFRLLGTELMRCIRLKGEPKNFECMQKKNSPRKLFLAFHSEACISNNDTAESSRMQYFCSAPANHRLRMKLSRFVQIVRQ